MKKAVQGGQGEEEAGEGKQRKEKEKKGV